MELSIIVAVDKNWAIGKNNQLLWHLPSDLKHFKELTMGCAIIMGRKTFESIGKALPGRTSIIITRDKDFKFEGCLVVNTISDAITAANQFEKAFIIGGGEIYNQTFNKAKKIFLTKVDAEFDADTFFPEISLKEWSELSNEHFAADEKNKFNYTFLEYKRK
ncbi:MAG: dihydrofolate reductase [Bacteroidota bacterium]